MNRSRDFCRNTSGFSTIFDALLLLVMISIAGVILLPTITGNIQVRSVIDSKNQAESAQTLATILNGRMDMFEYAVAGDQLDAIAGPFNESSVYVNGKKLIFARELNHKTFADAAAEAAASQWVLYVYGKKIRLNFLMTEYTGNLESSMKEYLDRQIGDRYSYNLSVIWRPVVNAPVGSDVRIGEQVPDNAFVETGYVTMPYHMEFTREHVENIVNDNFDTTCGNISSTFSYLENDRANRTMIEDEISQEIFDSINGTIDAAVVVLMDGTLAPLLDEGQDTVAGHVSDIMPESGDELVSIINETFISTLEEEGLIVNGSLSDTLTAYIQREAKRDTRRISDSEIKSLVTELADMYVNDVITIEDVKDSIVTEVYSRISINRAEITLSIWEKRAWR